MKKPFCFSISNGPPSVGVRIRITVIIIHYTMDVTNLLIISLLLLEEEDTDDENRKRRERWAAMSQVEREERTRSIPRISLPEPKQSPWNIAYHSRSE